MSNNNFYVFHNADKSEWQKNESKDTTQGLRRGLTYMLCAFMDHGKSTFLKNMISDTPEGFDQIYILRDKQSEEWDKLPHTFLNSVMDLPLRDIKKEVRTLLILEDFDNSNLKTKEEKERMITLLKLYCSHFGLTICILCQEFFSVSTLIRRRIACFILWLDSVNMQYVIGSMPMSKEQRKNLLVFINERVRSHDATKYDNIYIDLTGGKYDRFRFNGLPIVISDAPIEKVDKRYKINKKKETIETNESDANEFDEEADAYGKSYR